MSGKKVEREKERERGTEGEEGREKEGEGMGEGRVSSFTDFEIRRMLSVNSMEITVLMSSLMTAARRTAFSMFHALYYYYF